MVAFPTYGLGTVSVAASGTTLTGSGTIWSGVNARSGDTIYVDGVQNKISDVTDETHLELVWPSASALAAVSYVIVQDSPLRFVGADAMADVSSLIAVLRVKGLLWYLPAGYTDPNGNPPMLPTLTADDGQGVLKIDSGSLWVMQGGAWVSAGTYKGFQYKGAYNSGTAYVVNDVITSGGSAYIVTAPTTGNAPPNAAYFDVFASKGDTGSTGTKGDTGSSYGGTATTSLAIGTGNKAFTTQAGLAYTNGARVRASSAANTSNWMEGLVTYSGTTLTMTADKTNGSGTFADWNFNIAGIPGAGDLSSANNLSDLASASVALSNLGVPAILRSYLAGLTLSTAGLSVSFGIAAGVATDSTSVSVMVLASAYTKTTSAWGVGSGNGGLDTGSIANNTWYHAYLIKRPDTGVVDVLVSLSATSPTLPTNYTLFRRIGSMKTGGGGNWLAFTQFGDQFLWGTVTADFAAITNPGTAAFSVTLNAPTGISVTAITNFVLANVSSSQNSRLYVSSLYQGDVAAGSPFLSTGNTGNFAGSTATSVAAQATIQTNTSGQVRCRVNYSDSNVSIQSSTVGWIDRRGRDD